MYFAEHAIHVFYLSIALLPFSEQETDKIVRSSTPVVGSLETVLDNVYTHYSDEIFNSVDVRYVENATSFPHPITYRYALNGEDRRREQYVDVENGSKYLLTYVNGQTLSYHPDVKSASMTSVKAALQDACNYLELLGIPLSDEQRTNARFLFPATLRDQTLDWRLDSTCWLVDGNECFKLTNKRSEEFFVDPQIGYSVRWKKIDSGLRVSFSDFKKISGKWMPFQVEMSGFINSKLSVESLELGGSKSLELVLPPGTMIANENAREIYFIDANGKRQDMIGAIDEAKSMLPRGVSSRWLIVPGILILVAISVYLMLIRKKSS